jgi:hypothetical protein
MFEHGIHYLELLALIPHGPLIIICLFGQGRSPETADCMHASRANI